MNLVDSYLEDAVNIARDNANHNASFSNMQAYVANETLKQYALNLLNLEDRRLHLEGSIHIHNLDNFFVPYCHGGSLLTLLLKGIVSGDVTCKPAKHLDTVVDHVANYLIMSQLEFAGAQSFSDFNTLLAPFVRSDHLIFREIKQCMQRLIFNLSFCTRLSMQSPFTNLTFNLTCPQNLENLSVVIGGEMKDSTYGDFKHESDEILLACNEVFLEGDGAGRPLTFPIPTLNLTKRVNQRDMAFQKIVENTSKRGSWYFMNYVNGFLDENAVRAMCCRLQLSLEELSEARGLWNIGDGTGSNQNITLNFGKLGFLTRKGLDGFKVLDSWLDAARRIHSLKRSIVEKSLSNGLMPLSRFYGLNLGHYFNTVGVIGLSEYFANKYGDEDVNFSLLGREKEAAELLGYVNGKIKQFQMEDGYLWNLEQTPGEGACGRFAELDRKFYPEIKTLGDEYPYYSTTLFPSSTNLWWRKRAEVEATVLPKFSGGTVFRLMLGREDEPEVIQHVLNDLVGKTIPYLDLHPPQSYCPKCMSTEVGVILKCKKCGGATEIWSRVVGYTRPTHKWSRNKQAEFVNRHYDFLA